MTALRLIGMVCGERARPRIRVTLMAIPVLALAVLLAGCGGSSSNGVASKSAGEILAASRSAAVSASSVRVLSRSAQGPLVVTLDLERASDGARAKASLLGLSFEVIRIDGTLYVTGNKVFLRRLAASTGIHIPSGRWLKTTTANARLAQLAAYTTPTELNLLLSGASPVKGATTTIEGQPVIALKESGKLYSGALYVATTGQPYPIEILKHGRETGQTTFTGWNQPISLTPPANAIAVG
jgi:hypothetical protein